MVLKYPPAHKDDIVDDFHGTPVADPYRWLEDPQSPDTQAFTQAQNKLFKTYLEDSDALPKIEARFNALWRLPRYGEISKKGGKYFFTLNDGSQDQPVLYKQASLDAEPEILIDPNQISEDGTTALMTQSYSKDGSLLAYGLAEHGSDWQPIRVRDTSTAEDLSDYLEHTRFSGIAWAPDNSGFFYNRFPDPDSVAPEDQTNYASVYWHQLGSQQAEDILVHDDPENKEIGFQPYMGDDGERVFLYVYHGTDRRNGIYYRKVAEPESKFTHLFEPGEAAFNPVGNIGNTIYIQTDKEAPLGKLIAIDLDNPAPENWETILPEGSDAIESIAFANQQFVVIYKQHASHRLLKFDLKGNSLGGIKLPALGTALLSGNRDDQDLMVKFESFLHPPTLLRCDLNANQLEPFGEVNLGYDPDDFETRQVFYPSKDDTYIPMFLTHKKGLKPNHDTPTLLYGYGGFNISITPFFSTPLIALLEQGWVYAVANLRGGDEYGEEWHQAGMLGDKQNVFDDFIAAAEWLIAEGLTSTPKLVIEGRSNGGLLTAACLLQRPELFGAALVVVPVIDMLRYHKFTVGRYWIPEYGDAEKDPQHFKFMVAYSPLHNVDPEKEYPPILITSADTDDRVVPMHAKKFAAALQNNSPGTNPTLIRIETEAGHGMGKPVSKLVEENAEIYAFAYKALGLDWE